MGHPGLQTLVFVPSCGETGTSQQDVLNPDVRMSTQVSFQISPPQHLVGNRLGRQQTHQPARGTSTHAPSMLSGTRLAPEEQ